MSACITETDSHDIVLRPKGSPHDAEDQGVQLRLNSQELEVLTLLLDLWENRTTIPGDVSSITVDDDWSYDITGQFYRKGNPVINA